MEAGVPFDASTRIMAGRSLIARPNSRAFRSLALSARQDLQYPAVNREGDRWQDAGWSSCPSSIHGRLPCLLIICSKRWNLPCARSRRHRLPTQNRPSSIM